MTAVQQRQWPLIRWRAAESDSGVNNRCKELHDYTNAAGTTQCVWLLPLLKEKMYWPFYQHMTLNIFIMYKARAIQSTFIAYSTVNFTF